MSIKERLEEYCSYKHTKIGTLCRHAGISQSYFCQVKSDIGRDIQARINNVYPDLNIEWLRTGEGKMLVAQEAVMTPYPENKASEALKVIEQPPVVPDSIARKPDINILEWADNADDERSRNAFNIASIIRRTRFLIQMNNTAMAPILHQNEYVFLKPFAKDSEIIDGEIYGIETISRGILIRYLYNDGDHILTRPENTVKFSEIRIPLSDVRNKYHIIFHGSTHLTTSPNNEAERTKQLRQQGEQISELITELGKAGSRQDRLISMLETKM